MSQDEINRLPELLKPCEAARLLRCHVDSLSKLRAARPDVGVRVPGLKHWRYRKTALLEVAGLERGG